MGDRGFVQTGSRKGSHTRENSFGEWGGGGATSAGGSSSSTSMSSSFVRYGGNMYSSARGEVGDPGFGWRAETGGLRGGILESNSSVSFQRQDMSYDSGSGTSQMRRMGFVGAVQSFGFTGPTDQQDLQQPFGASHMSRSLVGGERYSNDRTGRDALSDAGGQYDYTVTSPRSVRSSGNIPTSLDEIMRSGDPSPSELEDYGNDGNEWALQPSNGWMGQSNPAPLPGTRFGRGSSIHGSPRSQLSPVMEVADCFSPVQDVQTTGKQPVVVEAEDAPSAIRDNTRKGGIVSSEAKTDDLYYLSQQPFGPNVRNHEEPGMSPAQTWNGRSIDASRISGPPRAVHEQYIIKLRGAGERIIRIGKSCVKNVWFWIAVVGLVAGLEGFNEERRSKPMIVDESWWSDDEDN